MRALSSRGQHVARGRGVEHAERDVGAIGDVPEEVQHALAAMCLHHGGLDVHDVRARLLRMPGQVQAVLGGRRRRARLNHDVGVGRPRLLDRHLEQALALVERQCPELGQTAGAPEHFVTKVCDAVSHQGAVGGPVDVVAVLPRNGVYSESPMPRNPCRAHSRASFAVAIASLLALVDASARPGRSGTGPVGGALLREGRCALHRVLGREHRQNEFLLLAPHLGLTPPRGLDDDLLGHRDRQRTVLGDALGKGQRARQRLPRFGEHVHEAPLRQPLLR